jgi:hypothetical protein
MKMQVTGQRPSSEHCSQISQIQVNSLSERVLDTKHAPGGPFRFLKRRHGLADIIERGAGVQVNCLRVNTHHPDRKSMIVPQNAPCHGHRFEQQRLSFFEAILSF